MGERTLVCRAVLTIQCVSADNSLRLTLTGELSLASAYLPAFPSQVKKAVQALLAYTKTSDKTDELLLNENKNVYLMVTVWKIPAREQVIKM